MWNFIKENYETLGCCFGSEKCWQEVEVQMMCRRLRGESVGPGRACAAIMEMFGGRNRSELVSQAIIDLIKVGFVIKVVKLNSPRRLSMFASQSVF